MQELKKEKKAGQIANMLYIAFFNSNTNSAYTDYR